MIFTPSKLDIISELYMNFYSDDLHNNGRYMFLILLILKILMGLSNFIFTQNLKRSAIIKLLIIFSIALIANIILSGFISQGIPDDYLLLLWITGKIPMLMISILIIYYCICLLFQYKSK